MTLQLCHPCLSWQSPPRCRRPGPGAPAQPWTAAGAAVEARQTPQGFGRCALLRCPARGWGGGCDAEGLRQSWPRWLWLVPAVRPLTVPCFPLVQSLDWETFEQYCTWQLFLAHSIPLETIIPILQHLKYKGELSPARQRHGAGPRRP